MLGPLAKRPKTHDVNDPLANRPTIEKLSWDHPVNLIGEKVNDPDLLNCCQLCSQPILIYGRMIPCKHVYCLNCANQNPSNCIRCNEKISRIEECPLGTVFVCSHGGPRHGPGGCRRTYLSYRDMEAHVKHRHKKSDQKQAAQQNKPLQNPVIHPAMLAQPPPRSPFIPQGMPPTNQPPPAHLSLNHPPPSLPPTNQPPPNMPPTSRPPPNLPPTYLPPPNITGPHPRSTGGIPPRQPPSTSLARPPTSRAPSIQSKSHGNLISIPIQGGDNIQPDFTDFIGYNRPPLSHGQHAHRGAWNPRGRGRMPHPQHHQYQNM